MIDFSYERTDPGGPLSHDCGESVHWYTMVSGIGAH